VSLDIIHQHSNTLPSGFKITFTVGRITKGNSNSVPASSQALTDKPGSDSSPLSGTLSAVKL
jgi:hypothetical protein